MNAKNHDFSDTDKRLALLEQTCSHIYESLERIDKRFDKIDEKFEKLEKKIDKIDDKFDKKIDELDKKLSSRCFWFLALYIGAYGSILGLMAKGFGWLK